MDGVTEKGRIRGRIIMSHDETTTGDLAHLRAWCAAPQRGALRDGALVFERSQGAWLDVQRSFPQLARRIEHAAYQASEFGLSYNFQEYVWEGECPLLMDASLSRRDDGGFVLDATLDAKRKGNALDRTLFDLALDHIDDVLLVTEAEPIDSPGPRIVYVNHAFTQMTGYFPEEVIGKSPRILQGPDTDPEQLARIRSALENWEPCRMELVNYRKDGSVFDAELSIQPIMDDTGWYTHWVAIQRDVTARKLAEQQKLHADRLRSLGVLAGGIAHDFNNVLTGIWGLLELMHIEDDPKERHVLHGEVTHALEQARSLTSRLLTFSRGGTAAHQTLDITPLLDEALAFNLRGTSINPALEVSGVLPNIHADDTQVRQVLSNLILNARHAMGGAGHITLSACVETSAARDLPDGLGPGEYVRIDVRDDGPGISLEDLARVFDPYFTTSSSGTGLGLSIVHGIMQRHGGAVRIRSEVGAGTTISSYWPADEGDLDEDSAVSEILPFVEGTTVVVVEDEPAIRRVVHRILERSGYTVLVASHDEEGYALMREHHVDMVLLDLNLHQGVGWLEIAKTVRRHYPEVEIVLMSGYADELSKLDEHAEHFEVFLPKPFTASQLKHAMHEASHKRI